MTTPSRKEVFASTRINGEIQVTEEAEDSPDIVVLKCDSGHGLYVTHWIKRDATNCQKCKKVIKQRD